MKTTSTILLLLCFCTLAFATSEDDLLLIENGTKTHSFSTATLENTPLDIADYTIVFVDKSPLTSLQSIQKEQLAGNFIPLSDLQLESKYRATDYAY